MPTVPYVPKEVIQKVLQGNVLDRVRRLDEDHLIPRRFGGSPYCPPWALPRKNLITNGFTLPEINRTQTRPLNLLPHLMWFWHPHHHVLWPSRRPCNVEGGYTNQVQRGRVCQRHGAKVKLCSFEGGCTKEAKNGGVCQRHGAEVKFCSFEGGYKKPEREECVWGMALTGCNTVGAS